MQPFPLHLPPLFPCFLVSVTSRLEGESVDGVENKAAGWQGPDHYVVIKVLI